MEIEFSLSSYDLAFYRLDKKIAAEDGEFAVMLGTSSDNLALKAKFMLPP